jgi:SAM-dependent methyltransferase
MFLSDAQQANRAWWEAHPMTYDWEETLQVTPGSRDWFEEIDRRFLTASYFAQKSGGSPFSRFLRPEFVTGKDVLEVGCGMGTHAALLARAGARLTAIDLTEKAVEMTRRRFEIFGLAGEIGRADAENLPFPSATFDLVWSWGVIHHSSSMERCILEITRVLRDEGRLFLMVYYRPSLVYYLHGGLIRGVLFGQLLYRSLEQIYTDASDGFYSRVSTKKEIRRLLKSYEQISIRVVGLKAELFPMPRTRLKEKMEQLMPNRLASAILGQWGSMMVIEALKKKR